MQNADKCAITKGHIRSRKNRSRQAHSIQAQGIRALPNTQLREGLTSGEVLGTRARELPTPAWAPCIFSCSTAAAHRRAWGYRTKETPSLPRRGTPGPLPSCHQLESIFPHKPFSGGPPTGYGTNTASQGSCR